MVTVKGGCDKLYYTQHILFSNVGQLLIFFFEKQTHTQGRGKGVHLIILLLILEKLILLTLQIM